MLLFGRPEGRYNLATSTNYLIDVWISIKYKVFKDLFSNYESLRDTLLNDEQLEFNSTVYLQEIIDVSCLEDIDPIVDDALDVDNRAEFFAKCRWLDKTAMEMRIVFSGKEAELISSFCTEYREWLQYVCYIHTQETYQAQKALDEMLGEEQVVETEFLPTKDTMVESVNRMEKKYQEIVKFKAEEKIIKQIKL